MNATAGDRLRQIDESCDAVDLAVGGQPVTVGAARTVIVAVRAAVLVVVQRAQRRHPLCERARLARNRAVVRVGGRARRGQPRERAGPRRDRHDARSGRRTTRVRPAVAIRDALPRAYRRSCIAVTARRTIPIRVAYRRVSLDPPQLGAILLDPGRRGLRPTVARGRVGRSAAGDEAAPHDDHQPRPAQVASSSNPLVFHHTRRIEQVTRQLSTVHPAPPRVTAAPPPAERTTPMDHRGPVPGPPAMRAPRLAGRCITAQHCTSEAS